MKKIIFLLILITITVSCTVYQPPPPTISTYERERLEGIYRAGELARISDAKKKAQKEASKYKSNSLNTFTNSPPAPSVIGTPNDPLRDVRNMYIGTPPAQNYDVTILYR